MPEMPASKSKKSDRPFRVGRSRTGLGLFATGIFRKGDYIAEYTGPILTTKEADELERRGSKYIYTINSRWHIDGSPRSNVARYANHSCRPNAESDTRGHKVFLRAVKTIRPGDEITYDYGEDYFESVLKPIGCKCEKCREKRRERQRAYRAKRKRQLARLKARRNGKGH